MHVPWFFCPSITCGPLDLPAEEFRHAAASLRLRKGDRVAVFDGAGSVGYGNVSRIGRGGAQVTIDDVIAHVSPPGIAPTIAVAMPKAQRQSFLIEKCTELGVAELWPMTCRHSVVRAALGQTARWRRATIEAAKQCHRAHLPVVAEMQSFEQVITRVATVGRAVMAHIDPRAQPLLRVLRELERGASLLALVGPEGGWSDAEIAAATAARVRPVSLGPLVLRVETAAIAIAAVVSARNSADASDKSEST
jgi:16S rRNA (uracil1498-N3)-methyltransferase